MARREVAKSRTSCISGLALVTWAASGHPHPGHSSVEYEGQEEQEAMRGAEQHVEVGQDRDLADLVEVAQQPRPPGQHGDLDVDQQPQTTLPRAAHLGQPSQAAARHHQQSQVEGHLTEWSHVVTSTAATYWRLIK